MNKADLITAIEGRLGGRKAATDAVDAVLDVIIREVAKGNKVGITGFGTFEKVARAARTGRNPRTGATVPIKKTAVPKFKPGTGFKAVVAKPSSLPKTGNAAGRASATTSPAAKTAAKKTTKAAAKKTATKAAPAKKTASKAAPAKAAAKKTATKAAPAKKAAVKKTATKATPAKKTTAKKTTTRRTAK